MSLYFIALFKQQQWIEILKQNLKRKNIIYLYYYIYYIILNYINMVW